MTSVVLCASFPSGARGVQVAPYYSTDIALAVVAIAEATLRSQARLIFGAHPTISPIVLHTARLLSAGRQVTIYQSEYFESSTTEAVRLLTGELGAELRTTQQVGNDRSLSLTAMRREMFSVAPEIAFFCGGMAGLDEEFELARESGARAYLMVEPGGRAAQLAGELDSPGIALEGRAYSSLALEALEWSGAAEPAPSGPFEEEMYPPDSAND